MKVYFHGCRNEMMKKKKRKERGIKLFTGENGKKSVELE